MDMRVSLAYHQRRTEAQMASERARPIELIVGMSITSNSSLIS
jgi:hypothetical protein